MAAECYCATSTNGELTAQLDVRLKPGEKLAIRNYAIREGRSISDVVREWIGPELAKLMLVDAAGLILPGQRSASGSKFHRWLVSRRKLLAGQRSASGISLHGDEAKESGRNQEWIAKLYGKSRQWVSYHLTFGRFLSFATTVAKLESHPNFATLTERKFRDYWKRTQGTDKDRFAQVADMVENGAMFPASGKCTRDISLLSCRAFRAAFRALLFARSNSVFTRSRCLWDVPG